MVATFGSKGSPTRKEFIFELLSFFDPLENLAGIEKHVDGCSERGG